MDKITQTVAKAFKTDPNTASGILVASVVGLITILLIIVLILRRRSSKGNSILLVGLSDAGKTLIFWQFVKSARGPVQENGVTPETYTSTKENIYADLVVEASDRKKGSVVKLVDFPGAEKLRKRLFNQYLALTSALKGIVYVVDSATFPKLCKDVAELLYEVLCESADSVPLLIACNKQDMPLAKSSQVIRSGIEKEFALLNRTRAAALDTTEGAENRRILGAPGRDFKLDQLKRSIEFCECSAKVPTTVEDEEEEEGGLEPLDDWIANL